MTTKKACAIKRLSAFISVLYASKHFHCGPTSVSVERQQVSFPCCVKRFHIWLCMPRFDLGLRRKFIQKVHFRDSGNQSFPPSSTFLCLLSFTLDFISISMSLASVAFFVTLSSIPKHTYILTHELRLKIDPLAEYWV